MRKAIVKAITVIASILALMSACALDSGTFVYHIICIGCLTWIGLFLYANRKELING